MKNIQYITDAAGRKISVVIPIEDYEKLLEDLKAGENALQGNENQTLDYTEAVKEMRGTGEIDL